MTTPLDMDSSSRAFSIPHVLVRILKHLPARDIVNVRRVCKLWNEYYECDRKFVFRKFDLQPQEIDVLLRNTNCRRLNLEFQDCDLKCISDEMWKTWSPKLRSLCIYGCTTEIGSLQSIISNCVELEVLEFVLESNIEFHLLEQLLDYFIGRQERHTCLRKLSMNGQIFMTMSQFLKMLTVFPCIEDLHCAVGREGHDAEWVNLFSDSHGTYDLRKLRRNNGLWSERPVPPILDYQLFRLTTYKTIMKFEYLFEDVHIREQLFHFFTIQKDLEVIDLEILCEYNPPIDYFGAFIKSLAFYVLTTCSKLREFRLQLQDPFPYEFISVKLTSEESVQFLSLISNLQCLKIPFILSSETTVLPLSLPSLSLSVLQLNTKDPYFSSIVKLSPRLKHLDIDVYSDQQLRETIVTIPDLEILILRLHDCTNNGLTGKNEESSIRRLQKLKYLHIIDRKGRITKEVFDEFRFPRLEYLGLCFKFRDNLPETLVNIPAIRTLEVFPLDDNFCWVPEVFAELCKTLGNLKHLIVDELASDKKLSDEKKTEIFNSLSNLKFITCCREQNLSIFDRHSRRASSSGLCKVHFSEDKLYGRWSRNWDCLRFRYMLGNCRSE